MILRQKIEVIMLIALAFLSFATYHEGTGGVMWLQFLSVLTIFAFVFIFDWAFTNESNFMFDPDADNWRRKVVRIFLHTFCKHIFCEKDCVHVPSRLCHSLLLRIFRHNS